MRRETMIDTSTKNLSFLKTSQQLANAGVKNHFFMLRLDHPELAGINPFSDSLSATQKFLIMSEVRGNVWYYFREIARIPQIGTPEPGIFELNVGGCAIIYCCEHNLDHIVIMPRQTGKTITEIQFSIWCNCFATSNSMETYLHKNQQAADDNLKKFKTMKDLIPRWMLNIITDHMDKDNIEEKYLVRMNNTIVSKPSASSIAGAEKIGRGTTTPLIYEDEFAFQAYNKTIFNTLIPAWNTAAEIANKNDAPFGIRITTTPNSLAVPEAQFAFGMIQEAKQFDFGIYDIPEQKLHQYLKDNSVRQMLYIIYTWQELGKTQEWYNAVRARTDAINAQRELDLVWPESTEGMFFGVEQLDRVKMHLKKPASKLRIMDRYDITLYETPDWTRNYIISCDVATNAALDRSALTIIDPGDFHVVGLFYTAHIDTDDYRKLIYTLATVYFLHSYVVIENNSIGTPILDILRKDSLIEPRLYREEDKREAEVTMEGGKIMKTKRQRIIYGVSTTSASRPRMFGLLRDIVDNYPETIVSPELYSELKTLQVKANNRIEALDSAHDDIVMSYLIARYAIYYGECFKQRFHISSVPTVTNIRNSDQASDNIRNFADNLPLYQSSKTGKQMPTEAHLISIIQDMEQKDQNTPGYGYNPSNTLSNKPDDDKDAPTKGTKATDDEKAFDWVAHLND